MDLFQSVLISDKDHPLAVVRDKRVYEAQNLAKRISFHPLQVVENKDVIIQTLDGLLTKLVDNALCGILDAEKFPDTQCNGARNGACYSFPGARRLVYSQFNITGRTRTKETDKEERHMVSPFEIHPALPFRLICVL